MAFRGWLALDGAELVNSSRAAAHLNPPVPLTDAAFDAPASVTACGCRTSVAYDDTWPDLGGFFNHAEYTPENAPWFDPAIPQSREFNGVWLMKLDGLGPATVSRAVTEMVGSGAAASPSRDTSTKITATGVILACSNAGAAYGLEWLACRLRTMTGPDDTVLQFLAAHPGGTGASPASLVREMHGVVLTAAPSITDQFASAATKHRQANLYAVTWEMIALSPYAYRPAEVVPVAWDSIEQQPIEWVHATDCTRPDGSLDMPVLFSTECRPEPFPRAVTVTPVCGGCIPLGEIITRTFHLLADTGPDRCMDTAVTTSILNTGGAPLSLQGYWVTQGSNRVGDLRRYPINVSGLPSGAELVLDGFTGRYWANSNGQRHRPVGIIGTPNGAPWRAPLLDRRSDYDFVVQSAPDAEFEITLTLADREP